MYMMSTAALNGKEIVVEVEQEAIELIQKRNMYIVYMD